jgi:hypothetical protein
MKNSGVYDVKAIEVEIINGIFGSINMGIESK